MLETNASFDLQFLLNDIVDKSSDFFGVADPQGQVLFINNAWREMINIDSSLQIDHTFMKDYIYPSNIGHFQNNIVEVALKSGEAFDVVLLKNFKTLEAIHVEMKFFTVSDKKTNKIKYFMAFGKNIENTIKTESKLATILDTVPSGIFETDQDGNYIYVNKRWQELTGLDTKAAQGQGWVDAIHPDDRGKVFSEWNDAIKTSRPFDLHYRFLHTNQSEVLVHGQTNKILDKEGKLSGYIGTVADITQTQNAKIHTEQMISNTPGMVYQFLLTKGGEASFPFVSKQGFEIYEISKDLYEKNKAIMIEMVHPDDATDLQSKIEQSANQLSQFEWTGRIVTGRNNIKWVNVKSTPIKEYNGDILWDGILVDITKSKIQENEIKSQKDFLRNTLDHIPAVFYAKDIQGRMLTVNNAFRELFDWQDKEIIGKSNHELFPKELADVFWQNDKEVIDRKEVIESEEKVIDRNSEDKIYHSFKFPYLDQEGEIYAIGGVSLDITDKINFEKQAYQNSKLASIGEMAAGVGHEINNPLTIISGYIAIMLNKFNNNNSFNHESFKDYAQKIDIASKRIENIVKGLRTFARSDHSELDVFDPLAAFYESLRMLQEIYERDNIRFEIIDSIPKGSVEAFGSRGKLQQVYMNLFSNAKDALINSNNPTIEVESKLHGSKLFIKFRDNGTGIPLDTVQKIFDPFFTTKELHKGTGIGLSLVHNILHEMDGKISVQSELGKGTTFTIEIPVKKTQAEKVTKEINQERSESIFHLSALVVEDEQEVRELLGALLIEAGLDVEYAENGKIALDNYLEDPGRFDLIVSDIKMPVMDGISLLKKIRSKTGLGQPKFIFITGGVNIDLEDKSLEINSMIDGYLYKPFKQETVLKLLQNIMP
jgi:PAS domain S-box-containing protein